jgi:hypothetical protein
MNKNVKRLFDRIRNDLRAINHTRRDRAQVRLLDDLGKTLSMLESEVMEKESELATQEK